MKKNIHNADGPDDAPKPIFFERKDFDGTNSEIREHHYTDGKKLVVTRIGARKGGFSFEEAHEVAHDTLRYHKELEECGIPLPTIEQLLVEHEPAINRSVVVKSSPWAGHEVKRMIENADHQTQYDEIMNIVDQMTQIVSRVTKKRKDGWTVSVGIDPQASNFIIDDAGVMRYVDLFPTRIHKNGVPYVEWPAPTTQLGQELGFFKHFDIRGIILTKTAQLARLKPQLKTKMENRVLENFKHVLSENEFSELLNGLEETPWMQLRKQLETSDWSGAKNTIESSVDTKIFGFKYNVYTLRECALELAQAGLLDEPALKLFFKKSHFEDELPREVLSQLKSMLLKLIPTS